MSEIKLKPCPFCGGTNLRIMGGIGKYVKCRDCEASSGHLPGDACNADEAHAAEAWNNRVERTCTPLRTAEWLGAHECRPIDMGVRELKEWAFANMEGCDEPEWTLFSTINDAVERYWEAVEQ